MNVLSESNGVLAVLCLQKDKRMRVNIRGLKQKQSELLMNIHVPVTQVSRGCGNFLYVEVCPFNDSVWKHLVTLTFMYMQQMFCCTK